MDINQNITTDLRNETLIITINRPHVLNALNNGVFEELIKLFETLDISNLKGIVITGAGEKAFVAGADIKEFTSLDASSARRMVQRGHELFNHIENLTIPVIAAVNGFALGGGCELAMACHIRIAGSHAKFGQPEVNLGIIPGYGGTQRLPRLIGRGKATELMMTTEMIGAEEARTLGLVNKVVDPGMEVEAAVEMIEKIARKAPLAISAVLKTVQDYYSPGENGFESEIANFARLATTEDFKEGAEAFVEKRKPNWNRK